MASIYQLMKMNNTNGGRIRDYRDQDKPLNGALPRKSMGIISIFKDGIRKKNVIYCKANCEKYGLRYEE